MKKQNKFLALLKKTFLRLFGRNLVLKILSLVFATLLWGYVLTDINPIRTKTLTGVSVSFEGEADLIARGLIVRGIRSELLSDVEVKVDIELTHYMDLSASDVTATVSLKDINKADDAYRVKVVPYTSTGSVQSVSPQYVYLDIDTYATKSVPVEVQYEGTLPANYWAGVPVLSRDTVEIRGATQDVNRVSRAVCYVALTDRIQSYNDAVNVVFLDRDGAEVNPGLFIGETAAVTVKLPVLPKKTVPLDLDGALLGLDSLPVNYEIVEKKTNPETVDIVGPKELLNAIDKLELESIDLSGRKENVLEQLDIKVPDGVQVIGSSTVEAFINIQEKPLERAFVQRPVTVVGLGKGLRATLNPELVDVLIKGRISLVSSLKNTDIKLKIDVTGLNTGTYTLPVTVEIKNADTLNELEHTLSANDIIVRIERD
ncbi:MAG: CdaR family protein [Bacillota bacterium]